MSPSASLPPQPFFHVQQQAGTWHTQGQSSCDLGYEIPGSEGTAPGGVWARWSWDGQTLTVRNDRYGLHPLFIFANEREVGVSPSLVQLLEVGAPRELDDVALAVFLRLGYYLGQDTPFKAIRALPPAATLTWREGRLKVEGGAADPPPQDLPREQALDLAASAFSEAVARVRLDDREFVMPLSGGRDSRHILLELMRQGVRPAWCVTVRRPPPFEHSGDVETAGQLAAALKLEHRVLPAVQSMIQAELWKNPRTGFCADEHGWFRPLIDHLAHADLPAYDGLAGDVLGGGLGLTPARVELAQNRRWRELADHFLEVPEPVVQTLLRPEMVRRFPLASARQRVMEELQAHGDAASPVSSFLFWNRTRREVALMPYGLMAQAGVVMRSPFVDPAYRDLLASLPPQLLMDGAFHDELIRRTYPDYASVPLAPKAHPRLTALARWRAVKSTLQTGSLLQRRYGRWTSTMPVLKRTLRDAVRAQPQGFRVMSLAVYLRQLEAAVHAEGDLEFGAR